MPQISKHPASPQVEKRVYEIFIESVKNTKSADEVIDFLNDLLTSTEKIMLSKRVAVAFLLLKGGYDYRQISKILRVSLGTISRIHAVLTLQGEGFRKILFPIMNKQAMKKALGELGEIVNILPHKGANIGEWKKTKREARLKREKSFY